MDMDEVLLQPIYNEEESELYLKDEDLPAIITDQITKLNLLDKSVQQAKIAAANAKDSAETARSKSTGWFRKKAAIEELQSAGIDLAEAVQYGAEAQELSFEFQTKLAEITKYLFGLGASNIASNRSIVRQLELKLNGASKHELTELAKQELQGVIKQLKDQEDILKKQDFLSKYVKSHDNMLNDQTIKINNIFDHLKVNSDMDDLHGEKIRLFEEEDLKVNRFLRALKDKNEQISQQLLTNDEVHKLHENKIIIQAEKHNSLDERVKLQEYNNLLHEERLIKNEETDLALSHELGKLVEKDAVHDEKLEELENILIKMQSKISELEKDLETKANTKFTKIILWLSISSLALASIALLKLII